MKGREDERERRESKMSEREGGEEEEGGCGRGRGSEGGDTMQPA